MLTWPWWSAMREASGRVMSSAGAMWSVGGALCSERDAAAVPEGQHVC